MFKSYGIKSSLYIHNNIGNKQNNHMIGWISNTQNINKAKLSENKEAWINDQKEQFEKKLREVLEIS